MYAYRRLSVHSIQSQSSSDSPGSSPNHSNRNNNNNEGWSSLSHRKSVVPEYPFRYDEEGDEEWDELSPQEPTILRPLIGAKIEEVLDGFLEDALFRRVFPQPLPQSPLSVFFYGKYRQSQSRIRRSVACAMFAQKSPTLAWNPHSIALIDWIGLLGQEALVDAGLSTPADFIVSDSLTHRQNRRAVYEAAAHMKELASIRAGWLRSSWRYACRFVIYFVKGVFAGFGMYSTDRYLIPILFKTA